jgi:predicted dehydrogenase
MSVKVGVVGARGPAFVRGFQAHPDADVVALCDINEELLESEANKLGIPGRYRVYEDLLASDVEAVAIATPMRLHAQQSLQALDAGKHVLCDVTAGVSLEELWWLKEWAEKSTGIYMMAENYCYTAENQMIRNMVKDGVFGEIYFGEGEYLHEIADLTVGAKYGDHAQMHAGRTSLHHFQQLSRRGAFYPTHSLGPLMQWFEGDRIETVSCIGSGRHARPEFRQEDTSVTLCKLASGKLLKLRIDVLSPRPRLLNYYALQGTKGCYEGRRDVQEEHRVWLTEMDPDTRWATWRSLRQFTDYLPERFARVTEEQRRSGHWASDFLVIDDFINAIVNNTPSPISVHDACEWTAVGLLSEISVQHDGRPVRMPDFRGSTPIETQRVDFA